MTASLVQFLIGVHFLGFNCFPLKKCGNNHVYVSSPFTHFLLQGEDTETEVSPDSDEYVLVFMSQCERKLELLLEELQGEDLAAIMKEMEEGEVSRSCATLLQHRKKLGEKIILSQFFLEPCWASSNYPNQQSKTQRCFIFLFIYHFITINQLLQNKPKTKVRQ